MKVITNTDIRQLIIFSKRELGIYKLVYSKHKKIYFGILSLLFFLLFLLCTCIYFSLLLGRIPYNIAYICLFMAVLELGLLYSFEKKTEALHQGIQDVRIKKLKRYYLQRNIHTYDLTVINDLLRKQMNSIETNRIKFSVIVTALIFPFWEIYMNRASENKTILEVLRIFFPRVFIIAFLAILALPVYNFVHMTLVENFCTINNEYIISNIIFLNSYIIHEWGEMENARRRK